MFDFELSVDLRQDNVDFRAIKLSKLESSLVQLNFLDWTIVAINFAATLVVGLLVTRQSGKDTDSYFLSGRSMPWWLLGASIVATTFSTDTPNLVTDMVRQDGVAGNWAWWAFLLTGMVTVFCYARMWRRSSVMTDMEFYELRYDGKSARFLRGFRAVYLGLVYNVLVLSVVSLAAIKIGQVMLGMSPLSTILLASVVTTVFTSAGGFLGVLLTDLLLFVVAMTGSGLAAWYALQHPLVGGLSGMLSHEAVQSKMNMWPTMFQDGKLSDTFVELLLVPLAVQWWAAWYPGAEPGGGGYVAQRMLAARSENDALGSTLFFNICHYAMRPWPWIIVAFCSLIVFPDLESLHKAFPHVAEDKLGHDLAYPAMLTFLPHGALGLVVASLIAAYMSTVATHLNWGASYLVHDYYKRFVKPDASEKQQVWVARAVTVLIMVLSAVLALYLKNAKQIFDIVLMFGAGSGLVFLLRWYWWRVNAQAEIAAMLGSGIVALAMAFSPLGKMIPDPWDLPFAVLATTAIWMITMFLTPPCSREQLESFVRLIYPSGSGWGHVRKNMRSEELHLIAESDHVGYGVISSFIGCIMVYAILFGTGWLLYGQWIAASISFVVAAISGFWLLPRVIKTTAQ